MATDLHVNANYFSSAQAQAEKQRLENTRSALINILDDLCTDKDWLEKTRQARFNILEDISEEKLRLEDTRRALVNILDDLHADNEWLEKSRKARFNLLEDFNEERLQLEDTRRALINILDDFDIEKAKVEKANLMLKEKSEALKQEILVRQQAEQEIRQLAHRLAKVQDEERSALARELHDDVGQMLTYLTMLIHATKNAPTDANFDKLTTTTREMVQTIRNLMNRLYPPQLENLSFQQALEFLIEQYTKSTQIRIDFRCTTEFPSISMELKLGSYRIIQEALTNIARHARVDEAGVDISVRDGSTLAILVVDNGIGFDIEQVKKSIGLTSMRERAQALGGKVSIVSSPGTGTVVRADLPLVVPPHNAGLVS